MIAILGKTGQVGRALIAELGNDTLAFGSEEIDLANPAFTQALTAHYAKTPFSAIINAAAYTQVDKAESERELAFRVNGEAVGELANWCKTHSVKLIHYSTDYVFDGTKKTSYLEDDAPNPLSVYGESKLLGEQLIAKSGADYLIFRTSWVYDAHGKNFLNTMRRLFAEREEVRVVADQFGSPTYAPHLARATLAILQKAKASAIFPSGILHLSGEGAISWHDFARAILALASERESGIKCKQVQAITTNEYPTPARRPANSKLNCGKALATFGVALPHWQDGLAECYENIGLRH